MSNEQLAERLKNDADVSNFIVDALQRYEMSMEDILEVVRIARERFQTKESPE